MTPPTAPPRAGTALITGASSGIGLELARLLAADRWDLVLVARSAERLLEIAGELKRDHGTRSTVLATDLARPESARELAHELDARGIAVDVLVNNAGVGLYGPFSETPLANEMAMLQLNVVSLVALTKLLLPGMVRRHRGRILFVASTAGFVPGPYMAGYYASKAYVLSLAQALAAELAGTGVTVTVLAPGPTRTAFASRAKVRNTNLFRERNVMDAAPVARAGYRGLMAGKRLVVPGAMNKALIASTRLAPRALLAAVAKGLNARRG